MSPQTVLLRTTHPDDHALSACCFRTAPYPLTKPLIERSERSSFYYTDFSGPYVLLCVCSIVCVLLCNNKPNIQPNIAQVISHSGFCYYYFVFSLAQVLLCNNYTRM